MADEAPATGTPFGPADKAPTQWKKLLALLLLLLLLVFVLWAAYELSVNRRLPIPGIGRVPEEVLPPQYLYSIAGPQGADALSEPFGVEVSPDDRVFVTDGVAGVVRVYTVAGDYLYTFSEIADGERTSLRTPTYLEVNNKGELFVADRAHRSIYVFTLDGEYLRKVGPADPEEARTWGPLGLAFDEEDNLYVTDVGRSDLHQVVVFDEDGTELMRFGRFGEVVEMSDSPGVFFFPNGVRPLEDMIIVSDSNNRRIQVFDENGAFRGIMRTAGTPRGMDIDSQGRLYVADALAHSVDIYTPGGERIVGFGGPGLGPGQFRFTNDLSLDRRGRIFVTDRVNHQIQVWGWPEAAPVVPVIPETPAQWGLCLSPLLLLPLLLLLRRRRFAVTEDFLLAMDDRGLVKTLSEKHRWIWVVPREHVELYEGRTLGGVDLGFMLRTAEASESDVNELMRRIGVDRPTAVLLAIAQRTKALCTEDANLAVAARALGIDAYDAEAFIEKFLKESERTAGEG